MLSPAAKAREAEKVASKTSHSASDCQESQPHGSHKRSKSLQNVGVTGTLSSSKLKKNLKRFTYELLLMRTHKLRFPADFQQGQN